MQLEAGAQGETGGRADGRTGGRADGRSGGRAVGRSGGRKVLWFGNGRAGEDYVGVGGGDAVIGRICRAA
jgi:hypothetical protein